MSDTNNSAEKIKLLLDVYEQDRNHVMIFVSVCFALPAFTLSQLKLEGSPALTRLALVISLGLFVSAGLFFFRYAQRQNWKRLDGVQSILRMDPEALRETLMGQHGLWSTFGHVYNTGSILLRVAALFYVIFFVLYLFPKIVL